MNCINFAIDKDEKHHLSAAFFPAYFLLIFLLDGYFVSVYNLQ